MTPQVNRDNRGHEPIATDPEPRELRSLYIPDEHIEYPDTPEWRDLGPHVRRLAERRRVQGQQRILGLRLLALAACLMGVLAVVWILTGHGGSAGPEFLAAGTGDGAASVAAAGGDAGAPDATSEADLERLVARLELDYIALQLTELDIVVAGDPGSVETVLAGYDIDAVEYYLQ